MTGYNRVAADRRTFDGWRKLQAQHGRDRRRAALRREGAPWARLRPERGVQGGAGPQPAGRRRPPEGRPRALPPQEAHPRSSRLREGAHPASRRDRSRGRRAEDTALRAPRAGGGDPERPRRPLDTPNPRHNPIPEALYDTSMLLFDPSCDFRAIRVKMSAPHPVALQEAAR